MAQTDEVTLHGETSNSNANVAGPATKAFPLEVPMAIEGMVPLKDILERLVQQAFADLQNLSETLPNVNDLDRKTSLLRYTTETRLQFMKLLVLFRWSKVAGDIQKAQNLHAFLDSQDGAFIHVADGLARIHGEMKNARDQSYDIVTAIDVLNTGRYLRLPTIIKKTLIGDAPLTKPEIIRTVQFIHQALAFRVMFHEVLPLPFRQKNGAIHFRVDNEFEISLTLGGTLEEFCWTIISLNIFVKSGMPEFEDVTRLPDHQIKGIYDGAALRLQTSIAAQGNAAELGMRRARNSWPLMSLFDYMHLVCLNLQLEILRMQAISLERSRWSGKIVCGPPTPPLPSLNIRFWVNTQLSKTSASNVRVSIVSTPPSDNLLGDQMSLLEGYSVRSLAAPSHRLSAVLIDGEDVNSGQKLPLDPSCLDLEAVIMAAASLKGIRIIKDLYKQISDTLIGSSQDLDDADQHCTVELQETSLTAIPSIKVTFILISSISIDLDVQSGKIVLTYNHTDAIPGLEESARFRSIGEKVKLIEESINKDPSSAGKALLNLRHAILISQIESFASQLRLEVLRLSQFDTASQTKFGLAALEHATVFGLPSGNNSVFIVIAVLNNMHIAGQRVDTLAGRFRDFYRVWFIKTSNDRNSGSFTIDTLSPLSEKAINGDSSLMDTSEKDEFYWDSMTMASLRSIVLLCRYGDASQSKQFALSRLIAELNKADIKYSYIFKKGEKVEAQSIDEGSIAAKDPLLFIHISALFGSFLKRTGISLPALRNMRLQPFVGIFIGIEHVKVLDTKVGIDGDALLGGEGLSKFGAVAKVRLKADVLPQISEPDDPMVSYDAANSVVTFKLDPEFQSIHLFTKLVTNVAVMSQFSMDVLMRKQWCQSHGLVIQSFNLLSLTVGLGATDNPATVTIWCEPSINGVTKDDPSFNFHVKYSAVNVMEPSPFIASVSDLLERNFASHFNFFAMLQRLRCLSPLILLLQDLDARKRDVQDDTGPLVRVLPKADMCLQLLYGCHGINFRLYEADMIGIFDACQEPESKRPPNVKPVEYFSDATETLISCPHLVAHIAQTIRGPTGPNTVVLPLPHGVVVSADLLTVAFQKVEEHLENIASIYHVRRRFKDLDEFEKIEFQPSNLRIMFKGPIGVGGLLGSTMGGWKIKLVLNTESPAIQSRGPTIWPGLTTECVNILVEKINTIKWENTDNRKVLDHVIDYIFLPPIVLDELGQLAGAEKGLPGFEWCLNVPEGAPKHLPPQHAPATILDLESGRISVLFRCDQPNQPTRFYPLRYNYRTDVISLWRPSAFDDVDISLLPDAAPAEIDKLMQSASSSSIPQPIRTALAKISTSSRESLKAIGGPYKLKLLATALNRSPPLTDE
ncbi:mediator complex subunit [Phlyctochytrium planicorne]|nr:mediator complex subunit [Phlyctochytrium planicorne]